MPKGKVQKSNPTETTNGRPLGFKAKLWAAADALRNNIDAAEYKRVDKRWVYGVPPAGNANFAWVQHFIYHLAPTRHVGFVLANGSMLWYKQGDGSRRHDAK